MIWLNIYIKGIIGCILKMCLFSKYSCQWTIKSLVSWPMRLSTGKYYISLVFYRWFFWSVLSTKVSQTHKSDKCWQVERLAFTSHALWTNWLLNKWMYGVCNYLAWPIWSAIWQACDTALLSVLHNALYNCPKRMLYKSVM